MRHDFRPHGAREIRRAGYAFIEMKRRIERNIEQRTAMLTGVSHDLRTILTRFKLSLALMGAAPEAEDMQKDIDEMQRMLEAYLAFARGDSGEAAAKIDMQDFLTGLRSEAERHGADIAVSLQGDPQVIVRPAAFKRCLSNLIGNALVHARKVQVEAFRDQRFLTINVDDNGPGIPPSGAKMFSVPSSGSTRRAIRIRVAPASGSPSPATSPAHTAAILRSATAPSAACARQCACRSKCGAFVAPLRV